MKNLVFAVVAALTFSVIAADSAATDADKEAQKAAARQRMLEKTGGIVEKPGTGKVVIVNAQRKVAPAVIEEKVEQIKKTLRVAIELTDGEWTLGAPLPEGASVALYVIDDAKLPMSLVATEAHWGVVNAAALDTDARFGKAFVRTTIQTLSGGISQLKNSPMQTVSSPADLDKIVASGITFDAMQGIMRNLQNIGVTQPKRTTYRKAVMEGWASDPTNDYQKVIWEEVHAKPTNPMRIKFDPAKGE